jgi:hypothetical protein
LQKVVHERITFAGVHFLRVLQVVPGEQQLPALSTNTIALANGIVRAKARGMKGKTTHHTKPTETAFHVSPASYLANPTVFPLTIPFPSANKTFCDVYEILFVTTKTLFEANKTSSAANKTSVAITKVLFAANKTSGRPHKILFAATQSLFGADKTLNTPLKVLFASTKVLFAAEKLLCAATKTLFISNKVLYAVNKTSNAANKILFAAPDVPQPSTQRRTYARKTTPCAAELHTRYGS